MKLRFRGNSLRLRVNQKEVDALNRGEMLREEVLFPGGACFQYVLKTERIPEARASLENCSIQVAAPRGLVSEWAQGDEIGIYFSVPTDGEALKIAIEKDLVCVDGPEEERDPDAFPREIGEKVC